MSFKILIILFSLRSNPLSSNKIPHSSLLGLKDDPIDNKNNDHLVVLSHGILGTSRDLDYLGKNLVTNGCNVLMSEVNQHLNSLSGIRTGGSMLADEILEEIRKNKKIKRISFVGNSLGGLYARYAVKELFDSKSGAIAGVYPQYFITIATPHLGVRNFTIIEEMNIDFGLLDSIKVLISSFFFSTGKDIFLTDAEERNTLLYEMATSQEFLAPLKSFKKRRVYANLQNDLVVPLGTAAFLSHHDVSGLRAKHSDRYGIVAILNHTQTHLSSDTGRSQSSEISSSENDSSVVTTEPILEMIRSLDTVGWEKVLVNFKSFFPIAHNKICALSRGPDFITQKLLGFAEGRFVMEEAAKFLTT